MSHSDHVSSGLAVSRKTKKILIDSEKYKIIKQNLVKLLVLTVVTISY